MTYDTAITILVVTGVVSSGILLAFFSEILWYVERPAGKPGTIVTETAFLSIGWMFAYGFLVFLRRVFEIPTDPQIATLFIGFGFAFIPTMTVVRWIRWRYWNGGRP